jgi:hypothetical protein
MKTFLWCLLIAAGCAETPMVKTPLDLYSLKTHETPNTKEGVGFAVEPITFDTLVQYPAATINARWNERNQNQVNMGMGGASQSMVERSARVPLLPLPSLIVRVVNHSGHTIKLAGAQFALKDDKGASYRLYPSANEIQGRIYSDIQSTLPELANSQPAMEQIQSVIAKLPLLNQAAEIKNDEEWQGYLAVDFKAHNGVELDALLQNIERFSLEIAGAKDDSGAPVALSAALDRVKLKVTMNCPQGAPPSAARCKPIQ